VSQFPLDFDRFDPCKPASIKAFATKTKIEIRSIVNQEITNEDWKDSHPLVFAVCACSDRESSVGKF
jgi:hypothetical protein